MSQTSLLVSSVPDELRGWMEYAVAAGASDLHLVPDHPPVIRKHGDLTELPDPPLDAEELQGMLRSICSAEAFARLVSRTDIDFSFGTDVAGSIVRFRANLFREGGRLAGCLRVIPSSIPDLAWAGFPVELAEKLTAVRDGLVILTGATGSGKTTTLAMIVNLINKAGGFRIITVEEPVEYVFPKYPNSVVTQREVGRDVPSFADGLKYGLRQDPDVILVGEVRDRETAQMALSAAETGHLVFATLHTRDAKGAITRFPDLFSADAQKDVRSQLAMSLRVGGEPAAITRHDPRGEAAPGGGGVVEHAPDRERHSQRQGGEHRQLHPHRPRGGDDRVRRIGPATLSGRENHKGRGGAERERFECVEPVK